LRIAVIRFSSLGDVLCTGPAVRGLRAAYPEAEIVFVTTGVYSDIAAALPGVDRVAVMERRGRQFALDMERVVWEGPWDIAVDLQGSPRSQRLLKSMKPVRSASDFPPRFRRSMLITTKIRFGAFQDVPKRMLNRLYTLGVGDDGGSLKIIVPDEAVESVQDRWGGGLKGALALIPGAKHETKRWPGKYWAELVHTLDPGRAVVIIGSAGDVSKELSEALKGREKVYNLAGETSLIEAAAALKSCSAAVTGDTGPMHLAVAVGTPVVAIFGPTVREFGFMPFRAGGEVLENRLWCRPCSAHGTNQCPLGHHKCMRLTKPADVLEALGRLD